MAYVAEGLVSSPMDWNIVTKFQRQNGSLFNSPAATAAALFHNYDEKALHYLDTIVNIFGGAGSLSTFPSEGSWILNLINPLSTLCSTNSIPTKYLFSAFNGGYS